jgi:ATP-dependent Lon protease
MVLFPGVVIPITAGRDKSIKLINDANAGDSWTGTNDMGGNDFGVTDTGSWDDGGGGDWT